MRGLDAPTRARLIRGNDMAIDRSEASKALAKAIAYKAVNKDYEAETWARRLVILLECEGILRTKKDNYLIEVGQNLLDCV